MTHTPTPWRIEEGTTLIWGDCNPDDNTDAGMGYPITECRVTPISTSSWCRAPYTDEGEANAAHIVKCVNLHDELVEALNMTLRGLIEGLDIMNGSETNDVNTSLVISTAPDGTIIAKARETLKKAGAL